MNCGVFGRNAKQGNPPAPRFADTQRRKTPIIKLKVLVNITPRHPDCKFRRDIFLFFQNSICFFGKVRYSKYRFRIIDPKTKGIFMFKYLFFDDQRLFERTNLRREYGKPELIADSIYQDPHTDINLGGVTVFRLPDGKYHMIYQGMDEDDGPEAVENVACATRKVKRRRAYLQAAVSDDGIHFIPRNTGKEGCKNPRYANSVADADWDMGEIGTILEDPAAPADERYKALMVTAFKDTPTAFQHFDYTMTSGDLVHWKKLEPGNWQRFGTEPIVGGFYNKALGCHTVICRPDCGERRVGYTDTNDFHTYTDIRHALQVDSLDAPLDELYGMPAFEYDNWYIGFPYLFSNLEPKPWSKGDWGTMYCQLAYSLDGHSWQRSLRTPFMSGWDEDFVNKTGYIAPILWFDTMLRRDDGSILLYSTTCRHDHGGLCFGRRGGAINVYTLRQDGFVKLVADPGKYAVLTTRENVWHGGEISVNCNVKQATMAVLEVTPSCEPKYLQGFNHEDCIAFSGDTTAWHPEWKGGSLDQFKDKVLIFQIKSYGGEFYSIYGDCAPAMFLQARKFERFGIDPMRKGW